MKIPNIQIEAERIARRKIESGAEDTDRWEILVKEIKKQLKADRRK